MATPLTAEKIREALGLSSTGQVVTVKPTSLDSWSKGLEFIANPLVQKYLDRILSRVIPAPKGEGGITDLSKPRMNLKAEDVYDFMFGFISTQDDAITMKQFKDWLNKEREKLIKVIDVALAKGISKE